MRKAACSNTYINRLKPFIRKLPFSQMKIDEITKYMDISKATLYKNFASKDEIIAAVVDDFIAYLHEGEDALADESLSFPERYAQSFVQTLKTVIYISERFTLDLKEAYPSLFDALNRAQVERCQALSRFFAAGATAGIFRSVNGAIFLLQDEAVMRRLLDDSFRIQYDLTLKGSLLDFYQLKVQQLFVQPEKARDVAEDVGTVLQTSLA